MRPGKGDERASIGIYAEAPAAALLAAKGRSRCLRRDS